jgi:hypothetical protein
MAVAVHVLVLACLNVMLNVRDRKFFSATAAANDVFYPDEAAQTPPLSTAVSSIAETLSCINDAVNVLEISKRQLERFCDSTRAEATSESQPDPKRRQIVSFFSSYTLVLDLRLEEEALFIKLSFLLTFSRCLGVIRCFYSCLLV